MGCEMTVHANSLLSWGDLEPAARHQMILAVYASSSKPLTDREVGKQLGFSDLNSVKPRISELINDFHRLMECASVIDATTNRTVRTVTIAGPRQMMLGEIL